MGTSPSMTLPVAPSMVMISPSLTVAVDRKITLVGIDLNGFTAANTRFAHAPGNYCRMRSHAPARGQYALGKDNAVDIVRVVSLRTSTTFSLSFSCFWA